MSSSCSSDSHACFVVDNSFFGGVSNSNSDSGVSVGSEISMLISAECRQVSSFCLNLCKINFIKFYKTVAKLEDAGNIKVYAIGLTMKFFS